MAIAPLCAPVLIERGYDDDGDDDDDEGDDDDENDDDYDDDRLRWDCMMTMSHHDETLIIDWLID